MKIIASIPNNDDCEVELQSTDTIHELKVKILNLLNIHTDSATMAKFRIIYKKKICKDQQTLSSLEITDGTQVVANLPKELKEYLESKNATASESNMQSSNQPANNFSFPQISTNQEVLTSNQISQSISPPYSTVNVNNNPVPSNNNYSFPQIPPQGADPSTFQSYPNMQGPFTPTVPAATSDNNQIFSFPQITTNQAIYSSNPTQETYTTNDSLSNPIVMPTINHMPSLNDYINVDQTAFENNVSLLVSLGHPERASRNILTLTGNNVQLSYFALQKGVLQDEESNRLVESLSVTKSPGKRQEIMHSLLKDLIYTYNADMSTEDKDFQFKNACNQLSAIRQSFMQQNPYLQGPQQMQMIQQSRLTQSERNILPFLRNAISGMGGFCDNPFAAYVQSNDESTFLDSSGHQSDDLFNKFLVASTLETEQWKFVAKCLLNNYTISEGLYYLECANNDPVLAASLMKD